MLNSVRLVRFRGLCSNRTWDKLDAANEVPDSLDKGWFAERSARRERAACRAGPWSVVFLD